MGSLVDHLLIDRAQQKSREVKWPVNFAQVAHDKSKAKTLVL